MRKIKSLDVAASLIMGFLIAAFLLIVLRIARTELNVFWQKEWDWLILVGVPALVFLGINTASRIGKKNLTVFQLSKFYLVGGTSAAIDLGVLNLLMWISGIAVGSPYILFKSLSALFSIMNGYLWNKHWTFSKNNCFFSLKEFLKLLLVISIGLLINVATASFMVVVIGPQWGLSEVLWANLGAFVAAFIVSFWNFVGQKLFVFKE